MLTRDHALVRYSGSRVIPDRLNKKEHPHYVQLAKKMVDIYQRGEGQTRSDLHRRIAALFKNEACPARRIKSFCKILDDKSKYNRDRGGKSRRLREKVFKMR